MVIPLTINNLVTSGKEQGEYQEDEHHQAPVTISQPEKKALLVTRSIRIPADLYERITTLAGKQHRSTNSWIIMTLKRETRIR